jgi:hypothetical protein
MSYIKRVSRVNKLDVWNCIKVSDLITSYKLKSETLDRIKLYIKMYISKAMQISFLDNDLDFIKLVDKSRNLKNITPNGAVVPKREFLLEYNLILREWREIIGVIIAPQPAMLNRFRLTPNIRIKFGEEIEENINRDLNTAYPHSDAWLEGPWGMNCYFPVMGDTQNNTLKYYKPQPENFSEDFVKISKSYKDMQWVMKYFDEMDFVPRAGTVYFSDYAMIHNTHRKKNAGTRISIDSTLYIGENPPHPDRESEYEKDFIEIGVEKIFDPGISVNEKYSEKVSTFSHYTTGKKKIVSL